MVLGTIIAIIMLAVYGIAMTILNYLSDKAYDKMLDSCIDLRIELSQALIERDDFKTTVEAQKDIIADLSRQINEATVKTAPDENSSETKAEEPKKAKAKKTTPAKKKTTTRKITTKKKEVK